MMPSLVFLAGPIAGRRFKLGEGEYVIGRRSDCQVFVPDMRVSRQHARLWKDGDVWTLEDLGSNNGTYVNGVRVKHTTNIRHDDEIAIANNRIRVEAREVTPEPKAGGGVTFVNVGDAPVLRGREDCPDSRAASAQPRGAPRRSSKRSSRISMRTSVPRPRATT